VLLPAASLPVKNRVSYLVASIEGSDDAISSCIRATAIDAYQRDWEVVVASDCVDSYDREHHDISLRYMNGKIAAVMDNAEICKMLAVRQ
jgi:isochorismate hydrolase